MCMRKITATILSVLSLSAFCFSGAAVLHATKTAVAETPTPALLQRSNTDETTLLSPNSYQEYLHLNAPTDVAATESYMAIADGNVIHLYHKKHGYTQYVHGSGSGAQFDIIKLQFDSENNLYFLDTERLHVLNAEDFFDDPSLKATDTDTSCNTFCINGTTLYYTPATATQILRIELYQLALPRDERPVNPPLATGLDAPSLAFGDGTLYYTSAKGKTLHKIVNPNHADYYQSDVAFFSSPIIHSMSVRENLFLCSDTSGNFYVYNLSDLAISKDATAVTPLYVHSGNTTKNGSTALSLYGDYVYAVKDKSICQFSTKDKQFTDFEICDGSNSVHRLQAPSESVLVGNKLYVADNGNDRISVYNTATQTFETPISTSIEAKYLASDGDTVLIANGDEAALYDLSADNYGQLIPEFDDDFKGTLTGVTNVYGKYYFVTEGYYCYVASQESNWTLSEPKDKKNTSLTAKMLTSDVYGYLYVASGSGVYRFTETQFLDETYTANVDDSVCASLPSYAEKILVDYAGNVYALDSEGKLWNAGADTPYALNEPLVHTDTAKLSSFAFGIEDNVTYLVYEENYLAQTNALHLPTIKNIPTGDAYENIFLGDAAAFSVVKTEPNALIVEFDANELEGATEFPYLAYKRVPESLTALKIGESTPYDVLATYDADTKEYKTCLVLSALCQPLDKAESEQYLKTYPKAETGYLTNKVSLYKYPHLQELPTLAKLPQGAQVTVLGEVNNLDYSYYHIEYVDENGNVLKGYVPQSYVAPCSGETDKAENLVYGTLEESKDSVWRLTYLILGTAVICILLDCLILRKKHKDD